jgi:hypothetical protein
MIKTSEFFDEQLSKLISELPDNSKALEKSSDVIKEIRKKFTAVCDKKAINDDIHISLYEETIRILTFIGVLSNSVFDIEKKIEEIYTKKYISTPSIGKVLWYDEYDKLHHQYNILKNKCFKLLDDLDIEFKRINHTHPKNWDARMYEPHENCIGVTEDN